MSNVFTGTTKISENTYGYHGYTIIIDERSVSVLGDKDGALTQLAIQPYGSHRPAPSHEVKLSRGKDMVWELIEKDQSSNSWDQYTKALAKVDDFDRHSDEWDGFPHKIGSLELYRYKDLVIGVGTDDSYNDCPWDDWDGEPTALCDSRTQFGSGWSHTYGKTDITITRNYERPSAEVTCRYISLFLGGVAEEFYTSSNRYIGMFTAKEIGEHFNGDKNHAKYALSRSIGTFREWAEGGPAHIVIWDMDGEVLESVGGFYEGEPYSNNVYAITEAVSMAEGIMEDIEAQRAADQEEVLGEMMAELGDAAHLHV